MRGDGEVSAVMTLYKLSNKVYAKVIPEVWGTPREILKTGYKASPRLPLFSHTFSLYAVLKLHTVTFLFLASPHPLVH